MTKEAAPHLPAVQEERVYFLNKRNGDDLGMKRAAWGAEGEAMATHIPGGAGEGDPEPWGGGGRGGFTHRSGGTRPGGLFELYLLFFSSQTGWRDQAAPRPGPYPSPPRPGQAPSSAAACCSLTHCVFP